MNKKHQKRSVFTYSLPERIKKHTCEGVFFSIISSFRDRRNSPLINGYIPRIKNIVTKHYRGLFGALLPIYCALTWHWDKDYDHEIVKFMWLWMFWFFLLQPVPIPVTGLIPIFFLPMSGVLSTTETCACYMNENIALFILASMLVLLLNNSGVDRRIAIELICSGDNCQFTGKWLLLKASTAAFFLSMFSNRLLVTGSITEYITEVLTDMQLATESNRGIEPDYDELRYIINNAIQTSASIGGIAIMHSSYASLCFRAMFCESAPEGSEYPDVFNYLQYSIYAFPVASVMFIINCCYHCYLINEFVATSISPNSRKELKNSFLQIKNTFPRRVTLHEKLTVFFTAFSLVVFFTRWNRFLDMGWANFSRQTDAPQLPGIRDATVAAIFVIALHILPKGYGWLNYISAETKSDLPSLKTESAILWWRFVDKNLNYGYIFLIGSGVALHAANRETHLDARIVDHFDKLLSDHAFAASLLLVCLVTVILANTMSGVAVCVSFLPVILSMASEAPHGAAIFRNHFDWPWKMYLGALAVGVGCSFGFMSPFLYTPAYYCHYIGKVPKKRMVIYSSGSAVICLIILWLSLVFFAPYIWDPDGKGVLPVRYGAEPPDISETIASTAIHTSHFVSTSSIKTKSSTSTTTKRPPKTTTTRTTTRATTTTRTRRTKRPRRTRTSRTRPTWPSATTSTYSEITYA